MALDLKKPSKRVVVTTQRWKPEDLRLVDAAVAVTGLTRSDLVRRAAIHEARQVVLAASEGA